QAKLAGEVGKLIAGGVGVLQPAEDEGAGELGAGEGALALNEAGGAGEVICCAAQDLLERLGKPWYAAHWKAPLAGGGTHPHPAKSELSLSSLILIHMGRGPWRGGCRGACVRPLTKQAGRGATASAREATSQAPTT